MPLSVDVISDVICPWCFVGKRRLEKAIADHGGPVKVRWHPFQLNPTMPEEGISRRDYPRKRSGNTPAVPGQRRDGVLETIRVLCSERQKTAFS